VKGCTEGWHRSLAQIIELAIFLLKDSLHLIIKSAKNNFLTKNYLGLFLDTFSEVVKNEAEKLVKTKQSVVQLKTAVVLVLYNLE
jgi:isocitrate dehydrogenase